MSERVLYAPAKINLTLEILAQRADGYHGVRSVMLPVALTDEIRIAPAEAFAFACEPAELTPDNLVVRAFERLGRTGAPYRVLLRKQIPAGAGLGGGSSDAAAIVRAASEGLFGPPPERDYLADARALGSDVPFFLVGTGALVEGTGERVTALGALPPWVAVILTPPVHVDTGEAYRRLAVQRLERPPALRRRAESAGLLAAEAVQRGDLAAALAAATNDFALLVAAGYPPVAEAFGALRAAGVERPLLSGSGGSVFALCADAAAAEALAAAVRPPPGAQLFVAPLHADPAWRPSSSSGQVPSSSSGQVPSSSSGQVPSSRSGQVR